jgi:outer membrane protein assembly factor BamD (BamD/ComL family)
MKVFFFSVLSIALIACNSVTDGDASIEQIQNLESSKNLSQSDSLIKTYMRFVDANPKHDSAVIYLFKAAQLNVRTNKVTPGARLYERVALEYKEDPRAPEALIRGGVAFATMTDAANAKRLYDWFIKDYPTHPRIEEVKMWSETSGMSDEQLMKRFQEIVQKAKDSTRNIQ